MRAQEHTWPGHAGMHELMGLCPVRRRPALVAVVVALSALLLQVGRGEAALPSRLGLGLLLLLRCLVLRAV